MQGVKTAHIIIYQSQNRQTQQSQLISKLNKLLYVSKNDEYFKPKKRYSSNLGDSVPWRGLCGLAKSPFVNVLVRSYFSPISMTD